MTNKEIETYIDEGYEECDKREALKNIISLHMHGEKNYYFTHPEEFEKDKQIYDMEYLGIYNYDDIDYYIKKPEEFEKDNQIHILEDENCMLKEKIEILKSELEHAIIPKYKIGQELYCVSNNYSKDKNECKIINVKILHYMHTKYITDLSLKKIKSNFIQSPIFNENELYETRQEAENAIEKLKNS